MLESCHCCQRLVVVAVSLLLEAESLIVADSVGFCASLLLSLSLLASLVVAGVSLLLSSLDYGRRRLVVVVVGFLSSLSSEAVSRIPMNRLFYIRLTMHTTTMETQHQAKNGPVAVSGV